MHDQEGENATSNILCARHAKTDPPPPPKTNTQIFHISSPRMSTNSISRIHVGLGSCTHKNFNPYNFCIRRSNKAYFGVLNSVSVTNKNIYIFCKTRMVLSLSTLTDGLAPTTLHNMHTIRHFIPHSKEEDPLKISIIQLALSITRKMSKISLVSSFSLRLKTTEDFNL